MKKGLLLLGLLILCLFVQCEFEQPAGPRLPDRWASKLIVPLFESVYQFKDLLTINSGLSADSTSTIQFSASEQAVSNWTIDDELLKINLSTITDNGLLTDDLTYNSSDSSYTLIKNYTSSLTASESLVMFEGLFSGSADSGLTVSLEIDDTLLCPLQVNLSFTTIKDNGTDTMDIARFTLAPDDTLLTERVYFSGDSLLNSDPAKPQPLKNIVVQMQVYYQDTTIAQTGMPDINWNFSINFDQLFLQSVRGYIAHELALDAVNFGNTPVLSEALNLDSVFLDMTLEHTGYTYDTLIMSFIAMKNDHLLNKKDTGISISATQLSFDVSSVINYMPDSLAITATYISDTLIFNSPLSMNTILNADYSVGFDLEFNLAGDLEMASKKSSSIVIGDSLTKVKISNAQAGAWFEVYSESNFPLPGSIILFGTNYPAPVYDSLAVVDHPGYTYDETGSIYFMGADTQLVIVDTLAKIDFDAASWQGGELVEAGKAESRSFASASVLNALSDTLYVWPVIRLENPDSLIVQIKTSHQVKVTGVLEFMFDAKSLYESEPDTTGL